MSATLSPPAFSSAVSAQLRDFARCIVTRGYTEFLGSIDPGSFTPQFWTALRAYAFADVRLLVDFLLLNKAVDPNVLDSILGTSWRALVEVGLAEEASGGKVILPRHSLFFYQGFLFFIDPPMVDPNVYFGDDSIGLFQRIHALPGDRVLDLCSGSGIQAMRSSGPASSVDVVELNEIPRHALGVNICMNGVDSKFRIHAGSLFDEVPEGDRFDLITANPPLVPFPDALDYPFVGHGGMDGFVVTRKVLAQLPSRLTERGRAQIIAMTFSSNGLLMVEPELHELARQHDLTIRVTVINHFPVDEDSGIFLSLAATAAPVALKQGVDIREVFRRELETRGLNQATTYFLAVNRGEARVVYQNFTRMKHRALWHVSL